MDNKTYENYCLIRDKKGYKDSEIATGSGVTKSTLSDWKAGRYTPKTEKLQKIADFLGVSVEYLMTGEEPDGYYLNNEARDMAQFLYDNPGYKVLFDASRKVKPDDIKFVAEMIDRMTKNED